MLCQLQNSQLRDTQVSVLRQLFEENLRHFFREGVIPIANPDSASMVDIILAVKQYNRHQRNPLLNKFGFY